MRTILLCAFAGTALATFQAPLGASPWLQGSDVQVFHSDHSSDHSIHIKRQNSTLCNTPVDQYTGWLNVGHHHLFFWYFAASAGNAGSALDNSLPLSLWLNGGPGASSMLGLLEELGPCLINKFGNGTNHNPYGWNKDTALLFVDEPAGVGFSYLDEGAPIVTESRTGMADMYIFLQMFITQVMPQHKEGSLHLLGESYGGHYIPALGTEILLQNRIRPHRAPVPLKSIAIGNAYVSPQDTLYGHWATLCTTSTGVAQPVFNKTRCDIIARNLPHCMKVYDICVRNPDPMVCRATEAACGAITFLFYSESFIVGGRNPYDISRQCEAAPYCYEEQPLIEQYLNLPSTFEALSVPSAMKNYSIASKDVNAAFQTSADMYLNYLADVAGILAAGIDVLVYQGNLDLSCNTAGAKRWIQRVAWEGQAEFLATDFRPWTSTPLEGRGRVKVGETKEVNIVSEQGKRTRFAFVTIDGAGHLVPQDQPVVALDMLTRWFAGKAFD